MNPLDISILGSGIATSLTLVEVFGRLLDAPGPHPLSIAVVEKSHEFWKGIPYGSRSSVNALTITCVEDFVNETERPVFFRWLKDHKDEWAAWYRANGGITAARWLENNLSLIDREDWKTVYIPRFLFGNYLAEKVTRMLQAVEDKGLARVRLIQAEAIDVIVNPGGLHEITLEHSDGIRSVLTTRKLVVSTGSAPVRKMCDPTGADVAYINDIYEPSVAASIQKLECALAHSGPGGRNVLVIGSNASSIELLYLLEGLPRLRELMDQLVIISPSGILPYHTSTEVLDTYPMPALGALTDYTIETLVSAATQDIRLALRDGANMDYIGAIIKHTLALMDVLDEDAKRQFYAIHGVRLRDLFRRAGPEYRGAADLLIHTEKVSLLKGRFLSTHTTENGAAFDYQDGTTGQEITHPLSFRVIINCSGSDNLDQSPSRLLHNLVHRQICRMNLSGKGFEVNERFEAAPNLYVMGPLLGGNMNKLIHFWQLENASRLTYLAPYLAGELLNGFNEQV